MTMDTNDIERSIFALISESQHKGASLEDIVTAFGLEEKQVKACLVSLWERDLIFRDKDRGVYTALRGKYEEA